jgi:hypothetical protein
MMEPEDPILRAKVLKANLHQAPSVGSLVPKILEINPNLTSPEVIAMVRQCIKKRGPEAGDFAYAEVLDEEMVLRLAKESLKVGK